MVVAVVSVIVSFYDLYDFFGMFKKIVEVVAENVGQPWSYYGRRAIVLRS